MTTRYQKSQIEDVAHIFAGRGMPDVVRTQLTADFADLFAANNPRGCEHALHNVPCYEPFDRKRFLAACGLESED